MTKASPAVQSSGCPPLLSLWNPDCPQATWPPGEMGRSFGTWVSHPWVGPVISLGIQLLMAAEHPYHP